METGLLREFLILAEEKNYWKAAERLYMNQSTLSKHIKTLEKTLSVPLFDRTTRMVELTEYGRLLLPYAQTMVQTQADCDAALLRQRELFLHTVRIDSASGTGIRSILCGSGRSTPIRPIRLSPCTPAN